LAEKPISTARQQGDVDFAAGVKYACNHPDFTSYHLLFLLRDYSRNNYDRLPDTLKGRILCSSLKNVRFVNDWGYLDTAGPCNVEPGIALISVGKVALPYLADLMEDDRDAPCFGSEYATMAKFQKYRRCDFAYRYAMLILGRKPEFSEDLEVRNRRIGELRHEL
jgi:hypothetical protein